MSKASVEIEPGHPHPLGASVVAGGVNFAVVSEAATAIELCLFDGARNERRAVLPTRRDGVHCGFVAGLEPGQRYGYRAHGRFAPEIGLRFDPSKVLLDPYAREIVGAFRWGDHPSAPARLAGRDNRATALLGRVAAPLAPSASTSASGRPRPRVPVAETILYELHVKGFSQQNPALPEPLRGTYAGLGHPASLDYLRALGVTTLSLMPVHYSLSERHLEPLGLRNYWGYNTLAYFCPDPGLSSTPGDPSATRAEFRAMVEAVHAAGLELVLDVVFNHTAEAGAEGPTLSLRGLDNQLYYRLDPRDRRAYLNWSGCGNTVDCHHPRATQLILDALRYWVVEMGVDGYRFDLAPALGRTRTHFDPRAPLLVALMQDPDLAGVKLIAEPWDLGPDGYQAGHFPAPWSEWNDHYRDDMRRLWLARGVDRGVLARRLAGSSERFAHGGRHPSASVNFVTAHDGFTLADVVSYANKHNYANGEGNRDGHGHELSCNCGVEGQSEDPEVLAERGRLRRALLASLLMSLGTPMLLAGDELGNSQGGNNNAYCQDNPIAWIDWQAADHAMLAFVRRVVALRRELTVFARDAWLRDADRPSDDDGPAVTWRRPDGAAMSIDDWHDSDEHGLAMILERGGEVVAVLLNPDRRPARFALPAGSWTLALDSASEGARDGDSEAQTYSGELTLGAQAVVVLRR